MGGLTITELGSLGEFIGAFAVVATLVYISIQLKQHTRAVRLITGYNVTEEFREFYRMIASNAELSEIYRKGTGDASLLTEAEKLRFNLSMHNLFRAYENSYYQYIDGALDPRYWGGISKQFLALKDLPGFNGYWQERYFMYSDEFQDFYVKEVVQQSVDYTVRDSVRDIVK